MDFPGEWIQPLMISSLGRYSNFGLSYTALSAPTAPTSGVMQSVNGQTCLIGFTLPGPYTIRAFWVYNGATVSGNIDLGIYVTNPGQTTLSRILSTGATAQSGGSTVQTVTCTATRLDRGTYYMALTASAAAATFTSIAPTFALAGGMGCHIATTAGSLPTTITPATWGQPTFRIPWMGFSRNTTI
jgi:hypothetical protein